MRDGPEYLQSHRFRISKQSRGAMGIMREMVKELPFVQGASFTGSRIHGQERKDGQVSDLDFLVFLDKGPADMIEQVRTWLEPHIKNGQLIPDEKLFHEEGGFIPLDRESITCTVNFLAQLIGRESYLESESYLEQIKKLVAPFMLGIGAKLYESRAFILDELERHKEPLHNNYLLFLYGGYGSHDGMEKGEALWQILMYFLWRTERGKTPKRPALPARRYPRTIAEARKYFILSGPRR